MLKRVLDVIGSLITLALASPLLLVIAVAIRLDTPGPVLFRQSRIGRGGRPFRLLKFRSMTHAGRPAPALTQPHDRRVTRVGRFLRPGRLDELPQLVNVLRGDMSLVGPRPEVPPVVEHYTAEQRQVLEVRPGITGPTQLRWLGEVDECPPGVDFDTYYLREVLPRKLASDLDYVRTRSFLGDVGYLLLTPLALAWYALRRLPDGRPRIYKAMRLAADGLAVVAASAGAFALRFERIPTQEVVAGIPLLLVVYLGSFIRFRTYRGIWKYVGVEDLWQLVKAVTIAAGLHAIAVKLVGMDYSRTLLVATPCLAILIMGFGRVAARMAERLWGHRIAMIRRNVVIVGAGDTGASIAREILAQPELGYDIVGFVDNDISKVRARIHNVPVLGRMEDLPALAVSHGLEEAIIAMPNPSPRSLRRVVECCARAGLEFKTLPSMAQLVRGEGKLRYLRKVNAEDLLPRERLSVADESRIERFLAGQCVMVTGAGGSIGSELCRQVVRLGAASLVMVERAENLLYDISLELQGQRPRTKLTAALADVKHVGRMTEIFQRFAPQVVFHAAAYKHVPLLEDHPREAVLNNVIGTRRLGELARKHNVRAFVLISTDKAASPSNLMGATKKICEMYVTALNRVLTAPPGGEGAMPSRFQVVRFGNVLGSAGSAIPLFQRQIENGGPVTITDPEVSRYFMTISEAVTLVLQSASLGSHGDVSVLDMGEPIKIVQLADNLITALGLSPAEVARQYVGLRPGEKMHEILWDEVEEVLPSQHERIFSVRQRARPLDEMDALLTRLEELAIFGSVDDLLLKVSELVPTYRPQERSGAGVPADAVAGRRNG